MTAEATASPTTAPPPPPPVPALADKAKAPMDANADADADVSRYNPYAGMDPNDPNNVNISTEDFQAMMRKKKGMGIPPLQLLQEKSKQRAVSATRNNENIQQGTGTRTGTGILRIDGNDYDDDATAGSVVKMNDDKPLEDDAPGSETPVEEEPENIPPPPPADLKKFLRMQKAGVPNQAILQLARVQGAIDNQACAQELKRLLGMDNDETDTVAATKKPTSPTEAVSVSVSVPAHLKRFLNMQKSGIPKEAILRSAKIHGYDCDEVEDWLARVSSNKVLDTDSATSSGSAKNVPPSRNDEPQNEKYTKYVNMRMKGIAVPFVLETAKNLGVKDTEMAELERILTNVKPTKTTRMIIAAHKEPTASAATATNTQVGSGVTKASGSTDPSPALECCFTPVEKGVAFHRTQTSPLASLVRKMVHTVDKTSRGSSRRKLSTSQSAVKNESVMVVGSRTLYHALGSFRGARYARDSYNETWSSETKEAQKNLGWVRAKRQSFKEIAKTIGLKLPADGVASIDGLDALIDYIEDRYQEEIQESLSLLQKDKLYDFDSLSTLYEPGSRVVAKSIASGGVDMICRVSWNRIKSGTTITGRESKHFEVCFEFVVAVGTNQATIAEAVEGIDEFEGRRNIFSKGPDGLTFVPWMAYDREEQESLMGRYERRGRIYNEVALNLHRNCDDPTQLSSPLSRPTYSYKAYRKGCFFVKRGGFGGSANASAAGRGMATGGRIVIDAQGAYDYGNSLNVGYDTMITGIQYKMKEYKLQQSRSASGGSSSSTGGRNDKYIVDAAGNSYSTSSSSSSKAISSDSDSGGMVLFDVIPDDYLEMVWPCVIGFSLTAKAWGDCLVDGLDDIQFSEDIFDRLVLPESRKRLIKALVKHSSQISDKRGGKRSSKYNFQDLIRGKGEGSVFLLYGPPGVGKTLTAEAVAEVLQRPLYSLSMGTLGTTADDLERRLSEILKLSAKWNAIILLDEADSFLEKRSSTSSLERNAMVCVMLQLVEYFSGILFLTSNRMDSLDPAFQTRITLSLPYHDLTAEGRQKIWDNLLFKSGVSDPGSRERSGDVVLPPQIDTSELAQFPLNGREIKNAMRLALALAAEEDCALTQTLLMETAAMVKPVSSSEGDAASSVSGPSSLMQHLLLGVLPFAMMGMYHLFLSKSK